MQPEFRVLSEQVDKDLQVWIMIALDDNMSYRNFVDSSLRICAFIVFPSRMSCHMLHYDTGAVDEGWRAASKNMSVLDIRPFHDVQRVH